MEVHSLEPSPAPNILFDFYRAMLWVSATAVARCPSVCPSVRHTRVRIVSNG